jgi:polyisoprenoid-binding protein YceI
MAFAQNFVTGNGHAEVHGSAPVASYTGVSDDLVGEINTENNTVNFKLKLESLNTGNHKRNKHMYETLNISSYPDATFEGKLSGYNPNNKEMQDVTAKGKFTIHGVTKEIEVKGTLGVKDKSSLSFTGSFPINITEYGMKRPSVVAYKVNDKHEISVKGTLRSGEHMVSR